MLGMGEVRELAHAMEDLLGALRARHQTLDPGGADLLFRGGDLLRALVIGGPEPEAPAVVGAEQLVHELRRWQASDPAAGASPRSDQPAAAGDGSSAAGPGAVAGVHAESPQPRALVVEDSATVRLFETTLLAEAGFAVDSVDNAEEAFRRWLEHRYDFLVTGMEIRGMRGLDLVAAIRMAPGGKQAAVVVMSSNQRPDDQRRAAALGVTEFLMRGRAGEQDLVVTAQRVLAAQAGAAGGGAGASGEGVGRQGG
jgi:two-component system chemotaxis response regulator CheY